MRYPPPSALIDQFAYLVDELHLMTPFMKQVPRPLLEARPMQDTPSILEMLGQRATAEERLLHHLKQRRFTPPSPPVPDKRWNQFPVEELLQRLQTARQHTVSFLETLPEELWEPEKETGSLASLIYDWIQEDVRVLRYIGERLRESQLTLRAPRSF